MQWAEIRRHGNRGKTVGLHSGELEAKKLFTAQERRLSTVSVWSSTFSFTKKCAEAFWVDLVVHNPFNAEVNLSDLTIIVTGHSAGREWTQDLVDVEVLGEIVLDPKETRTVNIVGLFNHVLQANFLYLIRSQCQSWRNNPWP